jgi:hypothetical protein
MMNLIAVRRSFVLAWIVLTTLVHATHSVRGRSLQQQSPITTVQLVYAAVNATPPVVVATIKLQALNVINLATLGIVPSAAKFNLNVLRTDANVNSVLFSNGQAETSLPFAYCSNVGPIFNECPDLVVGARGFITMIPFSLPGLQGMQLPSTWINIQIVSGVVPPVPAPVKAPAPAPVAAPAPASVSAPTPPSVMCGIPEVRQISYQKPSRGGMLPYTFSISCASSLGASKLARSILFPWPRPKAP